ncbi:MAG: redoxin domain-containing protein [Terriglobales bacterium]
MRTIILASVAALAFLVGLYLLNRHRAVSASREAASAEHPFAPDFSLPDMTGKQLKLSGYRGKVVLLDFWATWCDPCREEVPQFVELQNRMGERRFEVIGVSMDDSPEPVQEFYRKFKINYPVVMGNAKVGELYGGVLGLPIAFVIGRDGRIDSKHIGPIDIALTEREIKAQLQAQ